MPEALGTLKLMYGIACIPPTYFSSPKLGFSLVILEIPQLLPPVKPSLESSNAASPPLVCGEGGRGRGSHFDIYQ